MVPQAIRDDAALFEMLDLLMSFETWSRLRAGTGLEREADGACEQPRTRRAPDDRSTVEGPLTAP